MKNLVTFLLSVSYAFGGGFSANLLKKDTAWFRSEAGKAIVENVLSWQTELGDWPKNKDNSANRYDGRSKKDKGTFDNQATTNELRFLAKAWNANHDARCEKAFLLGLDHILEAQYPNGGFPQSYPPGKAYPKHITFNDNSMVNLLVFLKEVAREKEYDFVDAARRKKAEKAINDGVECILKCQIIKDGKLTVWCAQHDEVTLKPASARKYELESFSGAESAGILRFLMNVEKPTPAIKKAIQGGVAWFEKTKITGFKYTFDGKRRGLIKDDKATPLWARFYDLETEKPFFCNRDGIKIFEYSKLADERANGYAWFTNKGEDVAREYAKWKKMHP